MNETFFLLKKNNLKKFSIEKLKTHVLNFKREKTIKETKINKNRYKKRELKQFIFFSLFRLAAAINGIGLLILFFYLISKGIGSLSFNFLTESPMESMTKGGILPCIVGTLYLCMGAVAMALPIGVATAIYLTEYAVPGKILSTIRLGVNTLAGIPSVIFGLFGLAFFCIILGLGVSLIAGSLTLGIVILPVIIGTTEEALKSVPSSYREASLALGATKFQTIIRVVLPSSLPGILTGSILGISRAAGETAPIMFTGAVFFTPDLPSSLFDEVMALPYHIYVLATSGANIELTRPIQYSTSLVLVSIILIMNLGAILLRSKIRRKISNG